MQISSLQQSRNDHIVMLWRCVGVAVVMLLCACTAPAVITTSSVAPEQSVLAYYEWLQAASPSAIEKELEVVNRERPDNELQRDVKLALLLSVLGKDDAVIELESLRLLEEINDNPGRDSLPVDYRIFASHWLGYVQQRRQLREFTNLQLNTEFTLEELQSTYRDLEERYSRLSQVMTSLEKQNGLLAEQNKLMQQQIDALTLIEQQLVDREQPQTAAPVQAGTAESAE